jgi:hypothetical protein
MDKANARALIEFTITMCTMTSEIQTLIPTSRDLFLVANYILIQGAVEPEDLVARQVGAILRVSTDLKHVAVLKLSLINCLGINNLL